MAERQGFEPWRRVNAYTLSKRAPSTTRPPLRNLHVLAGNQEWVEEKRTPLFDGKFGKAKLLGRLRPLGHLSAIYTSWLETRSVPKGWSETPDQTFDMTSDHADCGGYTHKGGMLSTVFSKVG